MPRAPLGVLFRDHWAGVLRVFFAAFIAMVNTMFQIFALNFATADDYGIGISSTMMLWLAIVANLVAIATIPLWARLSDRVGRKPVFVAGVARQRRDGHALPGRHPRRQRPAGLGDRACSWPASSTPCPTPSGRRRTPSTSRPASGSSGMAIGTQFGFALAGFTPTIAGWMMGGEADNWYRVAAFAVGACVISAVAVLYRSRSHTPSGHP